MMRVFLVGIVTGAMAAGTAFAAPAAAPAVPSAPTAAVAQSATGSEHLATVRIPQNVTADGQPLARGTYTLVLGEPASPPPTEAGDTAPSTTERWVQFEQRGQVKGREIASVVGADKIKDVAQGDRAPGAGRAMVQMLKGGEYLRVWVNRGGENYLIHLPVAK